MGDSTILVFCLIVMAIAVGVIVYVWPFYKCTTKLPPPPWVKNALQNFDSNWKGCRATLAFPSPQLYK